MQPNAIEAKISNYLNKVSLYQFLTWNIKNKAIHFCQQVTVRTEVVRSQGEKWRWQLKKFYLEIERIVHQKISARKKNVFWKMVSRGFWCKWWALKTKVLWSWGWNYRFSWLTDAANRMAWISSDRHFFIIL